MNQKWTRKLFLFFLNHKKPLKMINVYCTCNVFVAFYIEEDMYMIENLHMKSLTIGKKIRKIQIKHLNSDPTFHSSKSAKEKIDTIDYRDFCVCISKYIK